MNVSTKVRSIVVVMAVAISFALVHSTWAFIPPPPQPCHETGPITGEWTCDTEGSILDPGYVTWTNHYFCPGNPIDSPQLAGVSIADGLVKRYITYACPENWPQNYTETATNRYTPNLFFSPELPATATLGTNTHDAYMEGVSQYECCPNLGPVFICTITVSCVDPGVDDDADTLPDCWELYYFGNLYQGPDGDYDDDGLINSDEYLLGYDPTRCDDSDGDHLPDFIDADPQNYDTSPPTFVITVPAEGAVL